MRPHLASLVEDFRRHGGETAIVVHRGSRRYARSYEELAILAGRFAAVLEACEIRPGDRVLLWGGNCAEWVGAFFGCLLRGVMAVPLDAATSNEFAQRILADVSPRLIVGDASLLEQLQTTLPEISFANFDHALPTVPLYDVSAAVTLDLPFQIVFTSGTTSDPKGVVHTHRNVLASLTPIETEIVKYRKYERIFHPLRFLHSLPLSHVFGQFMGLWVPAILSAEVHFDSQLEPARMIEIIRRERISVLVAVPRVLSLLRSHLLGRFPSLAIDLVQAEPLPVWKRWWKLRVVHRLFGFKFWACVCGGASLTPELERFWNTLGFALVQGYGMTETAALVTLNHPFRIGKGTIGKVLPGREVRLGEDGEILVRGEMLSTATWEGGQFHRRTDAWLATGDLATEDEQGQLSFAGRKGDVIVLASGMNIHPADLERAMARQAGVRGCVVVPCQSSNGTEAVAVVLFSGEEEELQLAAVTANKSLSAYQQIRRCIRWPEADFPYTSTGKLLRRNVRTWACVSVGGHDKEAIPIGRDPLLNIIATITGKVVAEPGRSGRDLRLGEDLLLDSLGRVQLQSLLEQQMGIEISDDTIASVETLQQLRAFLDAQQLTTPPVDASTIPAVSASVQAAEAPLAADANIYSHWPWSWPLRFVRSLFIEAILRPLIWFLAAPRVHREELLPGSGPFLIVANHITAYDGALILYALPKPIRNNIAIAMAGELLADLRRGRNQGNAFTNALAPLGYWLVTALFNVFPLPRLHGFRRSFAHSGEAMDRKYSVLIFPEGARSRDASLQEFRPGIGLLAKDVRVPIIPVALKGLAEMQRTGWFRSGKLDIYVGLPMLIDEKSDPAAIARMLHDAVNSL